MTRQEEIREGIAGALYKLSGFRKVYKQCQEEADGWMQWLDKKGCVLKIEPWAELPEEREKDIQCPNCAGHKEIDHYKEDHRRQTSADLYDDGRHPYMGEYTHSTMCERCKGTGRISLRQIHKDDVCPYCDNGFKWNHSSRNQIRVPCQRCEGTHRLKPNLISGSLKDRISYDMTIPIIPAGYGAFEPLIARSDNVEE